MIAGRLTNVELDVILERDVALHSLEWYPVRRTQKMSVHDQIDLHEVDVEVALEGREMVWHGDMPDVALLAQPP